MSPLGKIFLIFICAVMYRSVNKYLSGCTCPKENRLDGQTALVVTADSEHGLATVEALANRGATVIMACVLINRCHTQRLKIIDKSKQLSDKANQISLTQIIVRQIRLSSIASIQEFSKRITFEFKELHIIIIFCDQLSTKYSNTLDGFEYHIGRNYLAGFQLSQQLLPLLTQSKSDDSSVHLVFVISRFHTFGSIPVNFKGDSNKRFDWWKAYTSSHLSTLSYAYYLHSQYHHHKVIISAVHPGVELYFTQSVFYQPFRYLSKWLLKSPINLLQTTLSVVTKSTVRLPGDVYFIECKPVGSIPLASDLKTGELLYQQTKSIFT